jgi:polysaccharide export outer membrane protein
MLARTPVAAPSPITTARRLPLGRTLALAWAAAAVLSSAGCQSAPVVADLVRGSHADTRMVARAAMPAEDSGFAQMDWKASRPQEKTEKPAQWAETRTAPVVDAAAQPASWMSPAKQPSASVPQGPALSVPTTEAAAAAPQAGEQIPPPRQLPGDHPPVVLGAPVPRAPNELQKLSLPPYTVAPPDILLIESTRELPTQKIRGQHLVRPDGTINLGLYGTLYVAGMTLDQIRYAVARAIESRMDPEAVQKNPVKLEDVNVDVLAYNSKVYYVITDGGGYGEQVYSFPVTGNETVLDAIARINGLPAVASKKHIWVARRTLHGGKNNILPVDWCGIAQRGEAATNYQLMPGDRVYVQADKLIATDSFLAKLLAPVERILGVTLLGSSTVNSIRNRNGNSNNP